jgi:Leucine Rich repeat
LSKYHVSVVAESSDLLCHCGVECLCLTGLIFHCDLYSRSSWQGKINSLKSLDLCYSSVKDTHIVKFMNLSSLEELNLDSCLVGDNAIGHLADNNVVPNLTSLDLADTNLTDLGMVKIAKFKKLTRLSLFYCNISNGGLRHISKLTELQVLNLDSRDISDDGLAHLRKLTNLKSLDVFSGRITDAGCVHISKIKSLESLELCGGGIGDLGCSLLASLDNLTCLNLSQNERITNRGAAALATLMNLKALNLSNTRVNSAALRLFGGLLKLQSLALYGCGGIDDENVLGKLRRGLPNLRCLRLNTTSDEDGMVVSTGDELDDDASVDPWNEFRSEVTTMEDDVTLYSDHD